MGSTETESFAIEWTPNGGARAVDDVEVPEAWSKALRGICHDLGRRQYSNAARRVSWEISREPDADGYTTVYVWIFLDKSTGGLGGGTTWRIEDSPTEVTQWLAELTQDAAGHTNVAWPHDDDGGLLRLQLRGENLVWTRPRTLEVVAPLGQLTYIAAYRCSRCAATYFVTGDET